jgi:hypothetical protein
MNCDLGSLQLLPSYFASLLGSDMAAIISIHSEQFRSAQFFRLAKQMRYLLRNCCSVIEILEYIAVKTLQSGQRALDWLTALA